MTDAETLQLVSEAFATSPRPEHFTDHTHCCECSEHDALLCSRGRDTLSLDDVGNPGWDPICFVTNEGFAYYFPALARLALLEPHGACAWYFEQLLFHLDETEKPQKRSPTCTPEQCRAVVRFLEHVRDTRRELVAQYRCATELSDALRVWSAAADAAEAG